MLMRHLKVLENQGLIRISTHEALPPGTLLPEVTQLEISNAAAAVLLITPAYLVSRPIMEHQLPQLLTRAEEDGTAILPLLVEPSMFSSFPELNRFKPFNPTYKTLTEMRQSGERNRFLVSVVEAVQDGVIRRRERASAENTDVIQRAYEAYTDSDLAGMLEFIDPDLEWTYLDPTLARPVLRVCHDRHELESWLRSRARHDWQAELEEIVPNGELVMVGLRIPGIETYPVQGGDDRVYSVFTLRGGRIIAVRGCRDRQEAVHLAGIRP